MADSPITGLPSATPLTGAELYAVVQGGTTKKSTANDILTFVQAGGGGDWSEAAGSLSPTTLSNSVSVGALNTPLTALGSPMTFQVHGFGSGPYVQLFATAGLVTDQPNTIPANVGGAILPINASAANGGMIMLGITGKTSTEPALSYSGLISNPASTKEAHHFQGEISNGSGTFSSLPSSKVLVKFDGNGSAGDARLWGNGSLTFQDGAFAANSILTMNNSDSGSKGFYPPRLSTTNRDLISSPGDGLQIYNITTHRPEWYNSMTATWQNSAPVSTPDLVSTTLATASNAFANTIDNSVGVYFDIPVITPDALSHNWIFKIGGVAMLDLHADGDGTGGVTTSVAQLNANTIFVTATANNATVLTLSTGSGNLGLGQTGGIAQILTGAGSNASGTGTDGAVGGTLKLLTGQGGDGIATDAGADGGFLSIETGDGGDGTATQAGRNGGDILIQTGSGGTDGGATAGRAGTISLTSNNTEFRVGYSSIQSLIPDNFSQAFIIQQATDNYFIVSTVNGSESVALGNNTTNPNLTFLGKNYTSTTTGTAMMNLADNITNALLIRQGSDPYIEIDTTNGFEGLFLGTGAIMPSIVLFGKVTASVRDNDNSAFVVSENGDPYIQVDTTNSGERVLFGNFAHNPYYAFQGSGTVYFGADIRFSSIKAIDATQYQMGISSTGANPMFIQTPNAPSVSNAGTAFDMLTGNGHVAVGATPGTQGGLIFLKTGDGGNGLTTSNPGQGGNFQFTTGAGGAGTTTQVSGKGGNIFFNAGNPGSSGGAGTGEKGNISFDGWSTSFSSTGWDANVITFLTGDAPTGTHQAGGAITMNTGNGSNASGTGTNGYYGGFITTIAGHGGHGSGTDLAGQGGNLIYTAGKGGNATAFVVGADGGSVTYTGGTGGDGSAAQRSGYGGNIFFQGGAPGTDNGGGLGNEGNIIMQSATQFQDNVGFFSVAPAAQQTGGSATAGAIYTVTEQAMLQAAYDCLRTFGLLT